MFLALVLAVTTLPPALRQPGLPPCVANKDIAAHIDSRLPSWMRVEIRAVMLSLPPCARRGTVASSDSKGRYITNNYRDYVQSRRQSGGAWTRIDSQSWRTPSGDVIEMPYEPPPSWLIGRWECKGDHASSMDFVLRADLTGSIRDRTMTRAVNEQGKFVQTPAPIVPIQAFAYRAGPLPDIYAGMPGNGLAYSVQRTSAGIALRNWGYFRDDTWNAIPTQPEWLCTAVM